MSVFLSLTDKKGVWAGVCVLGQWYVGGHTHWTDEERGVPAPSPSPCHWSLLVTVSQSQREVGRSVRQRKQRCKLGRCRSGTAFLFPLASWLHPGSLVFTGSFSKSSSNCTEAIWLNKCLTGKKLLQFILIFKKKNLLGAENMSSSRKCISYFRLTGLKCSSFSLTVRSVTFHVGYKKQSNLPRVPKQTWQAASSYLATTDQQKPKFGGSQK